ncbi:DUF2510 domain-containing protein [Lacisediminihabitans sp. FW035]
MAEVRLVAAPPGWFADPVGGSGLRWWSGAEWTDHVAPNPVIGAVGAARADDLRTSASPAVPLPGTFVPNHPETPAYVPFGGDRSGATADDVTTGSWVPIAPTRWNTGGAWALSATPLIAVVSGIGIAFAAIFSVWLALVIAFLPLFWMIAAATRDRSTLDSFGYRRLPSRWWLLLGPLGYLIARTVVVGRQSGRGSAPLLWFVGISAALTVISIVLRLLVTGMVPTA